MSDNAGLKSEELYSFLESALSALDEAAGDVDAEAHGKLAELKDAIQKGQGAQSPLLSEASIEQELTRLDGCLSRVEEKISNVDPLTKNLLGMSAEILTKSSTRDTEPPSTP